MNDQWKEYYARYPDLLMQDILGCKLNFFQRLILRLLRLKPQRKNYIEIDENFMIVFGKRGMPYFLYKENEVWKVYQKEDVDVVK